MKLIYSPFASRDLDQIQAYIDVHNPNAAVALISDLLDCCEALPVAPEAYRERPEIKLGLRSQSYKNYLIFYRIDAEFVRIERILHGSRALGDIDFG